ncbi:MAG TPA: hypothetical protein VM243_12225 [Phycisphaerae bacterium]|nr:hypothetical protein [Phycisphaerae bacterium]
MQKGEVRLLKELYKENDLPSDRLIGNPEFSEAFAREFNRRAATSYDTAHVRDELMRVRKDKKRTGGLPRLGRRFTGPKFNNGLAGENGVPTAALGGSSAKPSTN